MVCLLQKKAGIVPSLIFNFDETSINFTQRFRGKIIVGKNNPNITCSQPDRIESCTLALCIPALGSALDSTLLWPQTSVPIQFQYFPVQGIRVQLSESSWQTKKSFTQMMIDYYIPEFVNRRRKLNLEGHPILLFLDGHSSRVSVDFIRACKEENIIVAVLPSHTSSVTQPLDRCPNGCLKQVLTKYAAGLVNLARESTDTGTTAAEGESGHIHRGHTREEYTGTAAAHRSLLAEVLPQAVDAATRASTMRSGWYKSGLLPDDMDRTLSALPVGTKIPQPKRRSGVNISGQFLTSPLMMVQIWVDRREHIEDKLRREKVSQKEREELRSELITLGDELDTQLQAFRGIHENSIPFTTELDELDKLIVDLQKERYDINDYDGLIDDCIVSKRMRYVPKIKPRLPRVAEVKVSPTTRTSGPMSSEAAKACTAASIDESLSVSEEKKETEKKTEEQTSEEANVDSLKHPSELRRSNRVRKPAWKEDELPISVLESDDDTI